MSEIELTGGRMPGARLPESARALLVCSDETRAKEILKALVATGLLLSRTDWALDLETARGAVSTHSPDVILIHDSIAAVGEGELATVVSAMKESAPVILLSRNGAAGDLVRALEAGAAEHLPEEHLSPQLLGRALSRVFERVWALGFACQDERGAQAMLGVMEEGVVLHAKDGSVTACNAAAERVLAVPSAWLLGGSSLFPGQQAVGEDGITLLPEDEPAQVVLRTRQPCRDRAVRFWRPNGELAWVRMNAAPLSYPNAGERLGAITVLLDITERKSLEHALRGTLRMEAISRFAGGIAHEFNNLLTAILGYNEFLVRGLEPSDPLRHEAEEVQKAARRAAELTGQLLAFSRRQLVEPRVIDVNGVLSGCLATLRQKLGSDVHLRVLADPGLGTVRVDPKLLEQIIVNLATHARGPEWSGGEILIATANTELDEAFVASHTGSHTGPHVVLTIEDDGPGMHPGSLAHVFEPFFTTREHDMGTGLGLATAYGMVKQSQGYIEVASIPGTGTTFRVYFPRCDAVPDHRPPAPRRVTKPQPAETVLVVDADEQVRHLAGRILEQHGYTVLERPDAASALAVVEQHPGPIDLLITDVALPGLSGWDLAQRASEHRPGLRFVYLAGQTEVPLLDHGEPPPGVHVLLKPFNAEQLVGKLHEAISVPT